LLKKSAISPYITCIISNYYFSFDTVKIKSLAVQLGLYEKFSTTVYGYTDTLKVIRKKIPKLKGEKISYSEENLVKRYLPNENTDNLHDAIQDIIVLKKLVEILGISDIDIKNDCVSLQKIESNKRKKMVLENNKNSLNFLRDSIKPRMITKMAKEGINKQILIDAYKKDIQCGIKILLSTSINRKVRVTSSLDVINILNNKIKNVITNS